MQKLKLIQIECLIELIIYIFWSFCTTIIKVNILCLNQNNSKHRFYKSNAEIEPDTAIYS